jgi:hypothetical protein
MKRLLLTGLFTLAFTFSASATKWEPREFTCPIDNEKNTFMAVVSYGSYIYESPSKYQGLFFPQTDSQSFYICKKCHLATYMWDFNKIPKEKLPELRQALAGLKISKAFARYTELPVTERLEIMEKVYAILGKDVDWWENFYRLKGYHYGKEGNAGRAAEARRRSLEMITADLNDPKSTAPKKLLYYLSSAMKHFLGDDAGAIADLDKALDTIYKNKDEKPDENRAADRVLNERAIDYMSRIKSEREKPRLFEKFSADGR